MTKPATSSARWCPCTTSRPCAMRESAREAAVTEQTRREEAEAAAELIRESRERLRASEERVRLATDAAGLGVWILDVASGKIAWENERLCALFGLGAGDEPITTERFASEFAHPEDAAGFLQALAASAAPGHAAAIRGALPAPGRPRAALDRAHRHRAARTRRRAAAHPGHRGRHHRPQAGRRTIAPQRGALPHAVRVDRRRFLHHPGAVRRGAVAPFDYRFLEVNPAFEKHTGLKDAVGQDHAGTGARSRTALVRPLWPRGAHRGVGALRERGQGVEPLVSTSTPCAWAEPPAATGWRSCSTTSPSGAGPRKTCGGWRPSWPRPTGSRPSSWPPSPTSCAIRWRRFPTACN